MLKKQSLGCGRVPDCPYQHPGLDHDHALGREERLCCVLRSTAGLYGTLQMLISVGKSELSSSKGMWVCVCLCV